MLNDKTARKLAKSQALCAKAADATVDLPDWLVHTDPTAWDVDVLKSHAKALEAAGCHLRRLLEGLESQGVITR